MKQVRKRLFIDIKASSREREKIIYLAVENECNTLVFSFNDNFFKGDKNKKYVKLINKYALNIEAGGRDLSLLLPKNLFLLNRDLFRMEQGRRKYDHHFCPTNPQTISIVTEKAHTLLTNVLQRVTAPRFFHLLPDETESYVNTWCACPACRAFSPAEQYLIAVNTVSDVLTSLDNEARIFYIDFDTEPDAEGISPRPNMIKSDTAGQNLN